VESLLLATGFTGGLTLVFVFRWMAQRLFTPPAIQVHFSPKGGCTDTVVRELQQARREIKVLAYSFSSKPIAQALVDAHKRGVRVEVLLDRSNEQEEYSDLHLFLEHGMTALVDAHHAIAHNKVVLIDGKTIITGSFNFTHQAEAENAENLLVIKGHPELLEAYRQDFLAHKAHCQTPQVKVTAAASHRKAA
jgi:phosphatidylserine/phosphatidylglycerophosphate/cardiolipin synthase-like enzyme